MTGIQVQNLVGTPDRIYASSYLGTIWYYSYGGTFTSGNVRFDPETGLVVGWSEPDWNSLRLDE